ncbi:PEP-CTERM sorting domain-containing protein [Phycisphaeraceae bacterium D3-23]
MTLLDHTPLALKTAQVLVAAGAIAVGTQTDAAPINYGDFSGTTVMYLDVTETANSPGDTAPLFGAPSIVGDQLDFDPAGFSAAGNGGSSDITDAQLNYTLMSAPGTVITSFTVSESGDYSLVGTGSAATQVAYGMSIASITVLEIDGAALGTPITLAAASAFGTADLSGGTTVATPWDLSISYDVNAALTAAGIDYDFGASKIEIVIDDSLFALSESGSAALIAKKNFTINTDTDIPEPGSLALLGLGGLLIARRRRA